MPLNNRMVYPGLYALMPEKLKLLQNVSNRINTQIPRSAIKMIKMQKCIILEMEIAGSSHNNIFVGGHDNMLSVHVLQNNKNNCIGQNCTGQLTEDTFLQRHILLPDNADAEFGTAVFRNGILSIYIPTTQYVKPPEIFSIIVY